MPPSTSTPPPATPPVTLPVLPAVPAVTYLDEVSIVVSDARQIGLHRFYSLPIDVTTVFYTVPSGIYITTLLAYSVLSITLSSRSLRPSFEPTVRFPQDESSTTRIFFYSSVALFDTDKLSPCYSFEHYSITSHSTYQSIDPQLFTSVTTHFTHYYYTGLSTYYTDTFEHS